MSDFRISLIPVDPLLELDISSTEMTRVASGFFPGAKTVNFSDNSSIQFVDQGENFDDVSCPCCGTSLLDQFGDLMERAFDSDLGGFAQLAQTMPCCGAESSLDKLQFEMPAGFARYQLDIVNPEGIDAAEACKSSLEKLIGIPMKIIFAKY